MPYNNIDECDCSCHQNGGDAVVHTVACCIVCENCGKRIRRNLWEKHSAFCQNAKDDEVMSRLSPAESVQLLEKIRLQRSASRS